MIAEPNKKKSPLLASEVKLLVASVMSDSLQPHELWFSRLLDLRDSPGKHVGVGCCAFLQGIFLTQGLNPSLLFLQVSGTGSQAGSLPLAPPRKP